MLVVSISLLFILISYDWGSISIIPASLCFYSLCLWGCGAIFLTDMFG